MLHRYSIFMIVMLDADLATLYEVETKQLKRQVRRNMERFPEDFMFELGSEAKILRSQFGTLRHGEHSKYNGFHRTGCFHAIQCIE